ncbi:tRNA (adenosine(37)-N6)-dimethylallyltransferase MiaA [Aliihoeflea sp. PC F10.4]
MKNAVLIAGPTASGKSRLAMDIAREIGGVIVNADSMQVYSVLRVLTARPDATDEEAIPHCLFGHVAPSVAYSVAQWVRDVDALETDSRPRVFVGGTGLYFRALTEGLSEMPDIDEVTRKKWRGALVEDGAEALHRQLAERDPIAAGRLRPNDGQRIVRALEVFDSSGRSIVDWQGDRSAPLLKGEDIRKIVLRPERELLRTNIDRRFDQMIAAGALEEVRELLAMDLPPALPAMKAIGVRELGDVLGGKAQLVDAVERAKAATRQYAKRQDTWFRHQLTPDWEPL